MKSTPKPTSKKLAHDWMDYIRESKDLSSIRVQTEDLARADGYLIVLLKGTAIGAPRVLSPVSNGQLSLAVHGYKLDEVCKSFDVRKLPADVIGILR